MLVFGVIYYIILLLYYTLLLLYTILFSSSDLYSSLPSSHSFYTCRYLYILTYVPDSSSQYSSSSLLLFIPSPLTIFSSSFSNIPPSHSFYTCRYLRMFIYISSGYLSSSSSPEISPRTKYRRHVSSGVVLFVWCLSWCDGY